MEKHWSDMSAAERCVVIAEVHPKSAGTGTSIAAALSTRFKARITRNTVISMYSRHADKLVAVPLAGKLKKPVDVQPAPRRVRKPSARLTATGNFFAAPVQKAVKVIPAPVPETKTVAPAEQVVVQPAMGEPEPRDLELYQLERHDCRWPVSGSREKTLFCGHRTHEERSYCQFHAKLSVGTGSRAEQSAIPARFKR